jgi:hypothetical protein
MATLDDSVVEWPCGCLGFDIRTGPGASFVLAACGKHKSDHTHWRDFYGAASRKVDAMTALCVLDSIAGLVSDGWKLRTIRSLLGCDKAGL